MSGLPTFPHTLAWTASRERDGALFAGVRRANPLEVVRKTRVQAVSVAKVSGRVFARRAEPRVEAPSCGIPERAQAVVRIADTRNRWMAVPGFAGIGKSFMTHSAKARLEERGYRVTALAPYGSQKTALEGERIEARTRQSMLKAKDKHIDGKPVVFIDEAGAKRARQYWT